MLSADRLMGIVLCAVVGVQAGAFRQSFPTAGLNLRTTGESPYFILRPGYQSILRTIRE